MKSAASDMPCEPFGAAYQCFDGISDIQDFDTRPVPYLLPVPNFEGGTSSLVVSDGGKANVILTTQVALKK